jgi:hypothetical protein
MLFKKKIIYKNLMNLLFKTPNIGVYKNYNYASNHNLSQFEIKLYLIGLSFNRLVFNLDKIIFILCIVTNFMFFLSLTKPKVLFLGCGDFLYDKIIYNSSISCGQFFVRKYPFASAINHTCKGRGVFRRIMFQTIYDCILMFFSSFNFYFLKDLFRLRIPIIGLLESSTMDDIKPITYPIICVRNLVNCYFFSNYFSKILNSKNLKRNLFNSQFISKKVKRQYHQLLDKKIFLKKSFLKINTISYFLIFTNYTNINYFYYNNLLSKNLLINNFNILKNKKVLFFYFYKIMNFFFICYQKIFLLSEIKLKKIKFEKDRLKRV